MAIANDANDYSNETVGNPPYPFDFVRLVTIFSLETMKIVRALSQLET